MNAALFCALPAAICAFHEGWYGAGTLLLVAQAAIVWAMFRLDGGVK